MSNESQSRSRIRFRKELVALATTSSVPTLRAVSRARYSMNDCPGAILRLIGVR
jgi:hypothetical protein